MAAWCVAHHHRNVTHDTDSADRSLSSTPFSPFARHAFIYSTARHPFATGRAGRRASGCQSGR